MRLLWRPIKFIGLLIVNAILILVSLVLDGGDVITWWPEKKRPSAGKKAS